MNLVSSQHNRSRPGRVRSLAVGLAVLGLVAGCSVAEVSPSPTTTASASPTAVSSTVVSPLPEPSAQTPEPSAPTPGPSATSFTTSGVMSNWTGFSWSQLPTDSPLLTADFWQTHIQLLAWQHGYVIYGTTSDPPNAFVWT